MKVTNRDDETAERLMDGLQYLPDYEIRVRQISRALFDARADVSYRAYVHAVQKGWLPAEEVPSE